MKIRVRISNHQQFGRLARRFREEADGRLDAELGQALLAAAPHAQRGVQARVRAANFPAQTPAETRRPRSSTGEFRGRLAGAVGVQPLASPPGARISVDGEAVNPADGRAGHRLAQYSDGSSRRRWRHRKWGRDPADPKSWFNQQPDPWFDEPIRAQEPRFAAGVENAMDRSARRIER